MIAWHRPLYLLQDTWDLSAWIRVYSVYLDDRLAAYKTIRFDPEAHAAPNAAEFCDLKACPANELLDRLPVVRACTQQPAVRQYMQALPVGTAAAHLGVWPCPARLCVALKGLGV